MKEPGQPANEIARLKALHDLRILDTDSETAFDDVARLAAIAMQVPIALISLVDADRQWFKARYGLETAQLPRNISFCGHVVADDTDLIVPDAEVDARFSDNPIVTGGPHVRFYAGAPLRTQDGAVLGTLCAIDHVPRQPTPLQLESLDILARHVVLLLERRRLSLALADENALLRASEWRLNSVFEAMAEGVVVQDGRGQINQSNASACQILALTEEQLRGRTSLDPRWRAVKENGAPFLGEEHPAMRVIATGVRQDNVVMGVHLPEGGTRWISINSLPSRVVNGVVEEVVTTFHDITILRRAAARVAEQDRLVTTGTLAAGIGHEINNPLAFVIANLDLALDDLQSLAGPSPSSRLRDLAEMLGDAKVGADRIRKIVRGLRALAREDVALQAVDLRSVLDTSVSLAQHELRAKARVSIDLGDVPPVLGDESRLTQIVVNLLVNAAQAFDHSEPEVNRVSVTSRRLSDDMIRLTVTDNGPGILAEIRQRVFDPFFTTKEVGTGTGLGLAVSRGIAHAIGGELTMEASLPHGASFHLDLRIAPFVDDALRGAQDGSPDGKRGAVLIIDDDPFVLSTIRRAMAREHAVTAVTDPRVALAHLDAGETFDVIFCDVTMPYLNGPELFAQISARHPESASRIVFVTGGVTNGDIAHFLAESPNEIIDKPFNLTHLLKVARHFVQQRAGE